MVSILTAQAVASFTTQAGHKRTFPGVHKKQIRAAFVGTNWSSLGWRYSDYWKAHDQCVTTITVGKTFRPVLMASVVTGRETVIVKSSARSAANAALSTTTSSTRSLNPIAN